MLLRLVTCSLLLALAQLTSAGLAMPNHHGRDPAKGLDLLILHTNDMHSRYEQINRYSVSCSAEESAGKQCFGGFARVATQIKQARMDAKGSGPSVLALNAGDTFQGSIFHNVFRWRIAAELTNMLAFDAMALGNHEFDDGLEGLVPFLKAVNKSHFVAANLDASDFPELQTLFQPSVVLNVDGTRVGVIGYITNETSWLSHPSEKVRFLDEVETVTAEAERLHQEGVRIIIALGHSGFPVDKIIAQRVPHLDLVVGGHSHTFLYSGNKPDVEEPIGPYPTFVRQASGRIVPVVQAYAYTKYLGRIRVLFDVDGEIESVADVQGQPMLLDYTMEQDPEVEKVVETWRRKLEPTVTKPVGRTLVFLNGSCRARECNLGNLVSDALVYHRALRYEGPGWTDAPIGIQNGGNIRASIHVRDNGTITKRDTLEVCPFENLLLVIYVRGDILLEVLENSVKHYDTSGEHDKGSFLQFSGLKVVYNITSSGRRVVSASARCGNCTTPSYSEVRPDATYGVITNSFLYEGGDGYSMLTGLPNLRLPDITAYSALDEYLRSHIAVFPGEEGRIVFVNNEQDLHDQPAASVGSGASPSRVALLPVHVALLVLNLLYCALTSR